MTDENDFEIIESPRTVPAQDGMNRVMNAAAENFDRILDIAATCAEVRKIEVSADAFVKVKEAEREQLKQETESYVKKLEAETAGKIGKVEAIRRLMADFYNSKQNKLSGEEFSRIITEIINQRGYFDE